MITGLLRVLGVILAVTFVLTMMMFAFTDVWPYMHEVLVQQSWKPVCPRPDGALRFCPVWGS